MVKRPREWTWQWEALVFGAIALFCGGYALFGKKPSETGMGERHAAGKPAFLADYMDAGFWWAAVIVGWLALLLAVTAWIWAREADVAELPFVPKPGRPSRRFVVILLVILAAACVPRIMRMNHSFWGDEAWWYVDLVGGRYTVLEDDSLKFKRHSWTISAFFDKSLNNHYLYTIVARGFDNAWRGLSGAEPHQFSEAAVRVPALIAGLAGIAVSALLLRRMGHGRAGLVFAALLAFHPWHIRYSSEARGYSFLLLFLVLVLWFLFEALESGRWRWWVLFAVAQFGALYSWKGAVHPLAAVNLVAFTLILGRRGIGAGGILQIGRWGAANVMSLMAFVPLFMPAVFQIQRKLETSIQERGSVGADWFLNISSRLLRGTDWTAQKFESPFDSMHEFVSETHGLGLIPLLVVVALLAFGICTLWKKREVAGLFVAAPFFGALLALAHFQLKGNYLQLWYVFYAMPSVMALIAFGVEGAAEKWGGERRGRAVAVHGAAALAFIIVAGGPVADFGRHPVQDPRGASDVTRYTGEGRWHLGPSEIVTVGIYRRSVLYDPRIRQFLVIDGKKHRLRTPELLQRVMRDCDREGKALRVSMANIRFAEADNAGFVELVRDPRYFTPLRTFPAVEDYIAIETYEYKPGSLSD